MSRKKIFEPAHMHAFLTPGEALKMLRELQGLSQNDLAQLTQMTQSNISALENGSRKIGKERAIT